MASFPAFRPHGFALFLAPSEDRKKGRPGFPDRLAASTPLPERKRQGCMNGQWRLPARRETFTFSMEWRHAKSRGRLNDFKGSVIVCGCFITTVLWKYSLFLRFSPWRDSRLRPFSGYPFGTSRKKASTIFYNTAISKGSVIAHGCFVSSICWRYITFFQFFRWWTPWLGDFIGYFLGISRNKASAVFYDTAFQNTLDSAVGLI